MLWNTHHSTKQMSLMTEELEYRGDIVCKLPRNNCILEGFSMVRGWSRHDWGEIMSWQVQKHWMRRTGECPEMRIKQHDRNMGLCWVWEGIKRDDKHHEMRSQIPLDCMLDVCAVQFYKCALWTQSTDNLYLLRGNFLVSQALQINLYVTVWRNHIFKPLYFSCTLR